MQSNIMPSNSCTVLYMPSGLQHGKDPEKKSFHQRPNHATAAMAFASPDLASGSSGCVGASSLERAVS